MKLRLRQSFKKVSVRKKNGKNNKTPTKQKAQKIKKKNKEDLRTYENQKREQRLCPPINNKDMSFKSDPKLFSEDSARNLKWKKKKEKEKNAESRKKDLRLFKINFRPFNLGFNGESYREFTEREMSVEQIFSENLRVLAEEEKLI